MDPISAIFVMVVLTGAFAKGVDIATDGLLSAEVGGGVRGVSHYAVQAGRARWRLANRKAREIRMQSSQGRKVQEILDLAGMFVRVLSGEAVRFGSGVRSSWRSGREQARSDRTKRRGDAPWPATEWLREQLVRLQEYRTKTPNDGSEPEANDPNGPIDWDANGGCLVVLKFTERPGRDLPVPTFCGRDCDPGWRICPEHKAERLADPDYPNDDIDEYRAGPSHLDPDASRPIPDPNGDPNVSGHDTLTCHLAVTPSMAVTRCGAAWESWQTPSERSDTAWVYPRPYRPTRRCPACHEDFQAESRWPDAYRHVPDPNGDPNVPLESTVPNQNGDVRCGCCAQLHAPLEPGEHCPNCHIHDHPNGTTPNAPITRGPSMDINSAPAAIAAAEAFAPRFESLQSRADSLAGEWDSLKNDADTLHGEIATLMDGMGDFAIGGEADTAASVGELSESATSAKEQADNVVTSISTAKEAHAAYVDNLHLEYDNSIEAAAGKGADAHAVMQEA